MPSHAFGSDRAFRGQTQFDATGICCNSNDTKNLRGAARGPHAPSTSNEPIFAWFFRQNRARVVLWIAFLMTFGLQSRAAAAKGAPKLRRYETPYYLIYTDLDGPDAAEAVVRMKVLAEVYRKRTRELGFTGRIDRRLAVYLFKDRADYLATGAAPESAGAFLGDRLVVAATDGRGGGPAWHVVQHEAFHQFAAAVNGPDLPGWVNEGLGEYFGESLFTGDGYVTGVAPAWRVKRVKDSIAAGTFGPMQRLLRMPQEQWNEKVKVSNYDHAWSVVQFILHGRGGKGGDNPGDGDRSLATFVRAVADGQTASDAWREAFGDAGAFERQWRAYWESLPAEGTPERYAHAAAAAVTSLVARAAAAGQSFKTFDDFSSAADRRELRCPPDDWLPPSLWQRALRWAPGGSRWSLEVGKTTRVVLVVPGGVRKVGTFDLHEGHVREVAVRDEPASKP
jgi:hypothetical protein